MTTHDALLSAILADPADDLPRLVYADWLEENGQTEHAGWLRHEVYSNRPHTFPEGAAAEVLFGPGVFGSDGSAAVVVAPATPGVSWTVRRGFVSEVRCTLADWCGGECVRCGGTGCPRCGGEDRDYHDPCLECPACNNTGRTIAIGPAVVRAHPVAKVVTDHNPYFNGAGWSWYTTNRERMSSAVPADATLPEELFLSLTGWIVSAPAGMQFSGRRYRPYPTRELALDALSAACLKWAKAEAFNRLAYHPHPSAGPVMASTLS